MKKISALTVLITLVMLTCLNLDLSIISNFYLRILENIFHFPLFLIITSCIIYILPQNKRTLLYGAVISFAIAGLTEFLQIFNQRDADWHDLFLNVLGILSILYYRAIR